MTKVENLWVKGLGRRRWEWMGESVGKSGWWGDDWVGRIAGLYNNLAWD